MALLLAHPSNAGPFFRISLEHPSLTGLTVKTEKSALTVSPVSFGVKKYTFFVIADCQRVRRRHTVSHGRARALCSYLARTLHYSAWQDGSLSPPPAGGRQHSVPSDGRSRSQHQPQSHARGRWAGRKRVPFGKRFWPAHLPRQRARHKRKI